MATDEEKLAKKKAKAEYKAEKKRLKAEKEREEKEKGNKVAVSGTSGDGGVQHSVEREGGKHDPERAANESTPGRTSGESPTVIIQMPAEPWYKDPRWIGAIIGAVSLILTLIIYFSSD